MNKKFNNKILIILIIIVIISGYFFISLIIGNDKFKNLKSFLNIEQKELIKKYIFPYKEISQLQDRISQYKVVMSKKNQTIVELSLNLELQKKKKAVRL